MAAKYWAKLRRFLALRVLHTDDTPHAIALGAGIATLVAFLPLIGLQTVIAVGLAALFRANKVICVPLVWITNPFTWLPVYGACFGLGKLILDGRSPQDEAVVLATLQQPPHAGFFDPAFWKHWLYQLANLGFELWVGCLIVGVVSGVVVYILARRGVVTYRERHRRRILARKMLPAHAKPHGAVRGSDAA